MAKTPSTPNVKKTKTATKASMRQKTPKTSASKPATLAKVAPKKARLKKVAAKKPVSTKAKAVKTVARKPATNKTPVKNSTAKKTRTPQIAKKTVAKKTVAKTAARQTTAPKTLQAQVDHVAARLSAADSRTKKNIAALETEFGALVKQMGRTKAGQTRITRRVTDLSKTLTADLDNLQNDIRRELASVLQNPSITELQTALERADHRLSESESAQDIAMARINRHIADIATIVENRLSDETRARESAMAEMKALMGENKSQLLSTQAAFKAEVEKSQTQQAQATQLRFSNLQSESADAIRSLGSKIVDVAEEMGRRRDALGEKLRQELNENTLTATTEFEQFRRVMERRLEALETDVQAFESQIERSVAPLVSRVEGLEYGLTQAPVQHDYAPSLQAVPPMTVEDADISPLAAPVNTAGVSAPQAAIQDYQDDAFSPAPAPLQPVATLANPHPVDAVQDSAPFELTETAPAQAVPYDPAAYQQDMPQQQAMPYREAQPAQTAYADANPYAPQPLQSNAQYPDAHYLNAQHNAPQYEGQNYAQTEPPFPHAVEPQSGMPSGLDADLPYADPAYAEAAAQDESMGAARPGAFSSIKKIGSGKLSGKLGAKLGSTPSEGGSPLSALMTPRNLKLGGLVAALGLASFIGVQTLTNKDMAAGQNEFSVASNAQLDGPSDPRLGDTRLSDPRFQGPEGELLPPREGEMPIALTAEGRPILPPSVDQETIGEYSDNRRMALAEGGESALMQAVNAGNPVAQLQLGLSKIENGALEDGVALIRAAANQEQPAALYRLAKLYETGQGVGQDAKTARQLTERAARGGNRIAMHDLALYHAEGRGGVEVDMPTAAKWFEKAAERGVVDSQFNLGVLFESGQGLPQDMESALVWYSVAGAQGDQMAAGRVGVLRKTLGEDQVTRADTRIAAFTPSRIDEEANGIFNNVPWTKPSQVANNSAAKAQVMQTQTLLNELGYAVGKADGAIGPKTKNAIMNFQKNNNLSETGTVNSELIERLQMATGA